MINITTCRTSCAVIIIVMLRTQIFRSNRSYPNHNEFGYFTTVSCTCFFDGVIIKTCSKRRQRIYSLRSELTFAIIDKNILRVRLFYTFNRHEISVMKRVLMSAKRTYLAIARRMIGNLCLVRFQNLFLKYSNYTYFFIRYII